MSELAPATVAALYQFAPFENPAVLRGPLLAVCEGAGIKGTLLLAHEGINGTIAGSDESVATVLDHIRTLPGCAGIEVKYSHAPHMPFGRIKVRLKREIVTMGEPDIDPTLSVGRYVEPQDWNALIADPDTLLIDARNDYEVAIGSFAGALDPQTASFREFPGWFRAHREALLAGRKRVAMYCTGGIRCEKSTSFLRKEGVDEVYHLRGGILKYLEEIPREESVWEGECFVFDERVSVGHGLTPGSHGICESCGWPVQGRMEGALAGGSASDGVPCGCLGRSPRG